MKMKILILLSLVVLGYTKVVEFNQQADDEVTALLDLLSMDLLPERFKPKEFFYNLGLDPNLRLTEFKWQNCGDPTKELMLMTYLDITPDPIVIPGNMNIAFNITVKDKVQSPLVADVLLQKKAGGSWVKMPCIDNVGSCHYDDFCQILAAITSCPPPFQQYSIPCQCPFNQGQYNLPMSAFYVGVQFLPAGDYYGKINMTMTGQPVGCYEVYMSIST